MASIGSLACVGIGMTLGSHISPRARSYIEQADVVFAGMSDGIVELWLKEMNQDVRSLQPYYQEGKSRMKTYREMVEAIMTEVRAGKRACGVFYGHPGVFAWVPSRRHARKPIPPIWSRAFPPKTACTPTWGSIPARAVASITRPASSCFTGVVSIQVPG